MPRGNTLPPPPSPGTARPSRRALTEWVTTQLYRDIFAGRLSAGDPLGEIELTARLGVSRTPVREALQALEAQGLLAVDPVNGRRVIAAFGVDDIRELYTIRLALERLAHECAASTMGAGDLAGLEDLLARMEAADLATSDGRREQYDADFRFHELACSGVGMPRLQGILSGLWLQSRALLEQLDAAGIYPRGAEASLVRADHRAVLDALRAGDGPAAGRAVAAHLQRRRDTLVAAVERNGGLR